MSRPPAQQLTALAANVFNPPRGDQGCTEEEAGRLQGPRPIPASVSLVGCGQGRSRGPSTGHEAHLSLFIFNTSSPDGVDAALASGQTYSLRALCLLGCAAQVVVF